jgi:hypothetical protein
MGRVAMTDFDKKYEDAVKTEDYDEQKLLQAYIDR